MLVYSSSTAATMIKGYRPPQSTTKLSPMPRQSATVTIKLRLSSGVKLTISIKRHKVKVGVKRPPTTGTTATTPSTSAGDRCYNKRSSTKTGTALMEFNLFRKLNWTSPYRVKRALMKEEYKVASLVDAKSYKKWRASFPDCEISSIPTKKERKLHLAGLWQAFRRESFAWTAAKGRVEHWSEFNKRNGEYLRSKFLKPSEVWAQYQATWLNLIGLRQ